MTATAIVFSCLFYFAALVTLPVRQVIAPCLSFMGLLVLSFAKTAEGYPLLPINNMIIVGWLCMTVVVTVASFLQNPALRYSSKGVGYMEAGSIVGMAVGLLGFTFTNQVNLLYGIMIVATAAGTFFGFLVFTNTPKGRGVSINSGNFFSYLLAKGFPSAITVMQAGVVLVLLIAMRNY